MKTVYLQVLRNCILFRGLAPEVLLPVLGGSEQRLEAGAILVQQQEKLDQVMILLEGTMRASRFGPEGAEFLYQQLSPAYLIGGEVVCTPKKTAPYSIYGVTDCVYYAFPYSALQKEQLTGEQRMALLENLLTFVANQNIRKYYKIDALTVKSTRGRILKYLSAQASRIGSNSFDIPFDREAMANYLCLNRSVLSHELKKMEADGLISFRKNHFTIFPEKLHGE